MKFRNKIAFSDELASTYGQKIESRFSSIPVLLIALMDDGTTGYKLVLHNIYFYVFAIY